jgi:outer membrane protein assembly factor BamA
MVFPEIGLGPLFGLALEGIDIRDNQRDFGLTRDAFVPALLFRPARELSAQLATSLELNDVKIFNADSVEDAIRNNRSLERLLRFPDGRTVAVAQRLGGAWDRRDNAFAATRGTLFAAEIEHVNAFPADSVTRDTNPITSHFLRISGRVAGYLRFTREGLSLALTMASGGNIQLVQDSRTYPDRLFYLGGFDSHRAFLTDALIPEDVAQRILDTSVPPSQRLTVDDIGVRGGDLMLNPRAELRIPLGETFATALFLDAGNVWVDPSAVDPLALRLGAGSGLRVNTPIGPLALDYGINLDRREALDEDFGALHFSVGLF